VKAEDALKQMVLPSHRRPVWMGGICQIMVTRACNLSCVHCTQGSNLAGKPVVMKPDEFERAVKSLAGYWGVVGTFGGNPAMSPYFEDYCRILRAHVPLKRRGLWCNHPKGKGKLCRITFWPGHSNLNCHLDREAYDEFARDWPESIPYLKGMDRDSIHSAPFVAIKDVIEDEGVMWDMISNCDINRFWSACIGVVPGKGLRAFVCELMYSQAALHADDPDWPDTGLEVAPGWWRKPLADFEHQFRHGCPACGIAMRREGQPAIGGTHEEYSITHQHIARPKVKDRPMQLVTIGGVERSERPATEYLSGTTPGYRG
jgi:hypothetical protein